MKQEKIFIYGKHALGEALAFAPHLVRKVYLASTVNDLALRDALEKAKVSVAPLGGGKNPGGVEEDAAHQGVIAEISLGGLVRRYEDFIKTLEPTPSKALVVLNEVQDPHNVGAIIRSAAAFGIGAVLIPPHNQAPVTGTVVKVSAGMAFRVPLVEIGNVNHTLEDLKKRGFWIYGLAGEGATSLSKEEFTQPAVFVLGNEGKGIREKTREHCDILLSIPMHPGCESLNVGAAAAVTLYAWSVQHPEALA